MLLSLAKLMVSRWLSHYALMLLMLLLLLGTHNALLNLRWHTSGLTQDPLLLGRRGAEGHLVPGRPTVHLLLGSETLHLLDLAQPVLGLALPLRQREPPLHLLPLGNQGLDVLDLLVGRQVTQLGVLGDESLEVHGYPDLPNGSSRSLSHHALLLLLSKEAKLLLLLAGVDQDALLRLTDAVLPYYTLWVPRNCWPLLHHVTPLLHFLLHHSHRRHLSA